MRWQMLLTLVLAVGLGVFLGSAGYVVVANHASTPVNWTGCINKETGTIGKLKIGSNPLTACATPEEAKIHVSGGDITAVVAGTGLTGGATGGNATLGLDTAYLDSAYVNEGQADGVTSAMIDDGVVASADLASALQEQIKCAALPKSYANLPFCDLSYANLSSVKLSYAFLQNTTLSYSDLSYAVLIGAYLEGSTANNVNLRSADLSGADLEVMNLTGANLTNAKLINSRLVWANLTNANLSGANLTGADMQYAQVPGVTWANTICPDGTNSNAHGNTCVGHM